MHPLAVYKSLDRLLNQWSQWKTPLSAKPIISQELTSGLSHFSFLIEGRDFKGKILQYVARIENPQSRMLAIPLNDEIKIIKLASGIAPEIIFNNHHSLVTEFLNGSQWQTGDNLTPIGTNLLLLHQCSSENIRSINLEKHCQQYWQKLGAPRDIAPIYESYQAHLIKTLRKHPQQCLCHNDINPGNLLVSGSSVRFIDWEYAGRNSPYFDLAGVIEMLQLNDAQIEELSQAYWGERLYQQRREVLRDFQIIVRFVNWLWFSLKSEKELADESLQRIFTIA